MAIKIYKTSSGNGFITDCLLIPGRDFTKDAKKIFKPLTKHSIDEVRLYADRVIVRASNDDDYTMVKDADLNDKSKYPILDIEGQAPEDIEDLFEKFIAIL